MSMNVFEAVKQSLTTRQVAEAYGFSIKRSGMMVCPFHNDKNPSMKVDRRFHCFGCGEDGDVIDFTAKWFQLGLKEAAIKLAEDFSIPYDNRRRGSPKKDPVRAKQVQIQQSKKEEQDCYRILCNYLHLLYAWRKQYAPKPEDTEWNPLFMEALQNISHVEYLLDTFLFGEVEEKETMIKKLGKEGKGLGERISKKRTNNHKTSRECNRSQSYVGNDR